MRLIEKREADYEFTPDSPIDWKDYRIASPEAYEYALDLTKRNIKDAVQTFNYQINSMSTTNG